MNKFAELYKHDFNAWIHNQISLLKAGKTTGLPESTFPKTCPYTIEQLLDKHFYVEYFDVSGLVRT